MTTTYPNVPAADALSVPPRPSLPAWARRLGRWVVREPLLRFMMFGALIFVAAHIAQAHRSQASERIIVDPQVKQRLIAVSQMQDGVTPDAKQLAALVDEYIEDEALYREALKRGLDRDDEIVRRRLIQKMRYIEHDLAVPPTPGEQVLRGYYAAHAALFTTPESVGFEELYFSPDRDGWVGARSRAARAWARLAGGTQPGGASWPAGIEDQFPAEIPPGELTREDAARLFGASTIVNVLFQDGLGRWSQPIRSGYGWHLVRVIRRTPPRLAPFDEVRDQVLADWTRTEAQRRERGELLALRSQYPVVRMRLPSTVKAR